MTPTDKLPRITPAVDEHLASTEIFKDENLESFKALPQADFVQIAIKELFALANLIKVLAAQVDFLAERAGY